MAHLLQRALLLSFLAIAAEAQQPTYTELLRHPSAISGPIHDSAFGVPAKAAPPTQHFEGSLHIAAQYGDGKIISTLFDSVRTDLTWKQFPAIDLDLTQSGDRIIPIQQGLVITGSVAWNIIVGNGRVWDQSGDHGYTRAALPFALIERSQNCVHNGELTFLFSNTHKPAISEIRYQVTQETCYYMKVDMWGQLAASYKPHRLTESAEAQKAFAEELAQRVPRKPLAALATDFPEAEIDLAAFLRGRKNPEDVTTYGVYFRETHYASGCPTRHGEYAFCDEMRLPSYSTAKSAFAGVAMMHLGQLYGPELYTQKISAYLPDVGQHDTWSDVSFTNALDMATGHFQTTGFEEDEDNAETKFLVDESLLDKRKDALLGFPAKAAPGTVWNYQSHNTFLATDAMNTYLKSKRGLSADLFQLVADDVYKPLHLSAGFLSTVRTDNSATGVPAGYFGLFYIQDDVVKLARFLNESGGMIDEKPVLDAKRLDESLFRTPGAPVFTPHDPRQQPETVHYSHAFWGREFTHEEYPQIPCNVTEPYMSGYGGISIVMLPRGTVFYVFSDAEEFIFNDAVLELSKLTPLCSRIRVPQPRPTNH